MPTVLEGILETHEGPEPRVVTEDVRAILHNVVRPGEDNGAAVALIADRARISARTVYRVLNPTGYKDTISLDLADRLCIACGTHLTSCRLIFPGNSVN